MARKKRKSKSSAAKKHQAKDPAFLQEAWLRACSNQRMRKAYEYMKEYLDLATIPKEHLKLAIMTLQTKVLQLHKEKNNRQIPALLESIFGKAPELKDLLPPEIFFLARLNNPNDKYLQNYQNNEKVQQAFDNYVRKFVTDPSEIIQQAFLDDKNEIKIAAKQIMSAWQALENGDSSLLDEVAKTTGRKSPLINWRLFLFGLHFYYLNDTENAIENLRRIEKISPLYKTAQNLSKFLKNGRVAKNEFQEEILATSQRDDLSKKLKQLESAVKKAKIVSDLKDHLHYIFTDKMYQDSPELYTNVLALVFVFFRKNFIPDSRLIDLFHTVKEFQHARAISIYNQRLAEPEDWFDLVRFGRFTKLEKALIHDWLAVVYSVALSETAERMKEHLGYAPSKKAYMPFYQEMSHHWKISCELYPQTETYKKWHKMATYFVSPAQSDNILEQLCQNCGENNENLYLLLNSARKRKAFTKVKAYLQRLDKQSVKHPALENSKTLVKFEEILALLQKNNEVAAQKHFQQLPDFSKPFFKEAKNALAKLLQGNAFFFDNSLTESYIFNVLKNNKFVDDGLLVQDIFSEYDAEKYFSEFEEIQSINDPLWSNLLASNLPASEGQLQNLSSISSERIWRLLSHTFIEQNNRCTFGMQHLNFFLQLSAELLKRKDKYLGTGLLTRAFIVYVASDADRHYSTWYKRMVNNINRIRRLLLAANYLLQKEAFYDPLKYLTYFERVVSTGGKGYQEILAKMTDQKALKEVKRELGPTYSKPIKNAYLTDYTFSKDSEDTYPNLHDGDFSLLFDLEASWFPNSELEGTFYDDYFDDEDFDDIDSFEDSYKNSEISEELFKNLLQKLLEDMK